MVQHILQNEQGKAKIEFLRKTSSITLNMESHIATLKTIYKSAFGDLTDLQFHQKIHDYIAYIVSTPELSSALLDESRKLINENKKVKRDPILSPQSKDDLITRNKQKSAYKDYMSLYLTMYIPLEDFNNGVYVEPSTLFYLKGKEHMKKIEIAQMGPSFANRRSEYQKYFSKIHEKLISLFLETRDKKQILPDTPKGLSFDDEQSILYINGTEVKISRQKKRTLEHQILNCFFDDEDNLFAEFNYAYLAEKDGVYIDDDENNWKRYYNACEKINNKVLKASAGKIVNFLFATTGNDGIVRINNEFIDF